MSNPFADPDEPSMDPQSAPRSSSRGYPLAALFVLMAVCAILSAMVAPSANALQQRNLEGLLTLVGSAIAGALVVGLLGVLVGLFHHRRWRGMCLGGLAGGLVGVFSGPIILVSSADLPSIALATLLGSLFILFLGGMTRAGA